MPKRKSSVKKTVISKNKWNANHYVRIGIMIKRDAPGEKSSEKEKLVALATAQGKSVSHYIIDAVNAYAGEPILSVLDNDTRKKKA